MCSFHPLGYIMSRHDLNSIDALLDRYDWAEAFGYASFRTDEVASVIRVSEGYNDGDSWLAVGVLKDGTFFFLTAWCDYTGWDCQAGGHSEQAGSLDELIRWRLGDADRQRLGYVLPDETDGAPLPVVDDFDGSGHWGDYDDR